MGDCVTGQDRPQPVHGPGVVTDEPVLGVVGVASTGSAMAIIAVIVRRPGAHTHPVSSSVNNRAKLGAPNTVRVYSIGAVHAFTDSGA